MKLSVFLLSLLSVMGTAVAETGSDLVPSYEEEVEDRGLILFDACAVVTAPVAGFVSCSCSLSLLPPDASASCSSPEICVVPFIVCGSPKLSVGVNLIGLLTLGLFSFPVSVEVCYDNLKILGLDIPDFVPLCFSFGEGIFSLFGFDIFGFLFGSSTSSLPFTLDAVTLDGETCAFYEECSIPGASGDTMGVIYDCSAIIPGMKVDECTEVGVLPRTLAEAPEAMERISLPFSTGSE